MTSKPLHNSVTALFVALASAAALVLSGCTHSAGTGKPTASPTSKKAVAASTGLPSGVEQHGGSTNVPNNPKLRQFVSLTSCTKTSDGWSAGGSASNAGSSDAKYVVTVFFITPGGTVINRATSKFTVQPGAHTKWSARAAFTPPPTTLCTLRGVA